MENHGCSFLEQGINFEPDKITDCCISHNDGRGMPLLINDYHGGNVNWNEIFDIKAKRIEIQKNKVIYDCENCYHLNDFQFSGVRKISEFHFSHCRLCNAHCIYCSDEYARGEVNYDTYPVMESLKEQGYYKSGGEATFQGGEPTLMQNFDRLIDFFKENGTVVRIHTSGIKHSLSVENALKENKGNVVISLDSGSRSVYKSIKRVDCFDTVCKTIETYTKASPDNVIIKYIIVPGYNDNISEIDKFFELTEKFGVRTVASDIEVRYARKYENKNVSPHVYLIADYFEDKAKKLNKNLLVYSFLSYVNKNRKIKKSPLINNKFLYSLYIKSKTQKEKNLKYV